MFYRLAPQLIIRSVWRPYWPRPGDQVLVMRAGIAFPPGHPTTQLCLELLAASLLEQPAATLLDVGCGTGILALAGARMGIPFNVGIDLAAQAIRAARENTRRNHLTGPVHWLQGSTEALQGRFELILANLPWMVLMEKATELQRLSVPQARLILSGFRETREEALLNLYLNQGWQLARRATLDRWEIELPPERSFTWVGMVLSRGRQGPKVQ
ncbi:MAG: 50S ribosomal protein L11 methyltransferase [Desulfobacteraceae bacterium]